MNNKLVGCVGVLFLLLSVQFGIAADTSGVASELKAVIDKIQTKLRAGERTEAALAPELKEFDALVAKHKGEKSDEVAQIVYMEAVLYKQVLKNDEKGDALMAQLQKDFPDSKPAQQMKKQAEAEKVRAALVEGAKFPDFEVKDLSDKPLSIANYKGKVVLLDFWATWCGPCKAELPNVIKTYEAHHKDGFEIIGISLDRDKDRETLVSFIKEKNMSWPQYFDGGFWTNKLAVKYGVNSIPATYLLDGQGNIIGKNLRGEKLEEAVSKALAKK
jgi:thiol-disulfide isomerase/thioredoxin